MTIINPKIPLDAEASIFEVLCQVADAAVGAGLVYAQADDPHRFATVAQEFDEGRAVRRLVLEYQAGGRVRVALRLDGLQQGEPHSVEVFAHTMEGESDVAKPH